MKSLSKISIILLSVFLLSACKEDNNVETVNPPPVQNPNSPVLVSPHNNQSISSTTPALDWEDYTNAVSYRVQVSLDANINGTMILDTSTNSSTITVPQGRLSAALYYYWRVIANIQGGGSSNWSAIWRFLVIYNAPAAPVLVSPTNNSGNISFMPLFDWNESPTAEFYRIQVSRNALFTNIVLDNNNITATQLQCPPGILITGTQYFWRVNASNSGGLSTSAWSAIFNFTTAPGPLPSSINGRVTFVDTNFVTISYYIVGAYSQWPPNIQGPDIFDSVVVHHQGNIYYADYQITNVPNASYKVALSVLGPLISENYVLGIYGCDTVHIPFSGCPLDPTPVTIQNYNGVENINFLGWADTTKRIY